MKINKHVKDLLKKLPLQKRLQFIEETRRANNSSMLWVIHTGGLTGFFVFKETKKGHDYWAKTFGWI